MIQNNVYPPQIILAIETSCDETACALMTNGVLVDERVYSQWRRHAAYGGVVPELASRDHLRRLLPMIDDLLTSRQIHPTHIAYTRGPGLASALLTGATIANALAFAWNLPVIAVNHISGHILSPFIASPDFAYPYLALLITGGHTQMWQVNSATVFDLLGETLDDAAGEAFDKTAVLLNLGYPGGAKLEKLAANGDDSCFALPSPAQKNLNFSFSGLKTTVRRLIEQHPQNDANIAASFQKTVAEGLARQVARALHERQLTRLAVVGGVAQNHTVWNLLQQQCDKDKVHLCRPNLRHCGDNAAMIAMAAFLQHSPPPATATATITDSRYSFDINPRWQPTAAVLPSQKHGGR